MEQKRNGQGLVEFSLIIPILVLLLLGIFEGARIIQSFIQAQNASREAARYAVSGQPLDILGNPWSPVITDQERMQAIQNVAIRASIGTAYTQVLTRTQLPNLASFTPGNIYTADTWEFCASGSDIACNGALGIFIEGQNVDGQYIPNTGGIQGTNVRVMVYHNVSIWDPIYSAIAPGGFVRVRAETVMRNEGVDAALGGLPPVFPTSAVGSSSFGQGLPQTDNPFIAAEEGDTFTAGAPITFQLLFHAQGAYDIYFGDDLVGTVSVDSTGTTLLGWVIPRGTSPGGYEIKSTETGQPTNVVSNNTIIVEPGLQGEIVINNNTSLIWPLGSTLNYQFVNHDPFLNPANLEIPEIPYTGPSLTIDEDGLSPLATYVIPPTATPGFYTFVSMMGTPQATQTVEFVQGCITVDQFNSCDGGSPPIFADLTTININVENHASNYPYTFELKDQGGNLIESIAVDAQTGSNGQLPNNIIFQIPVGLNGTHTIFTIDNGNIIAQQDIIINTPSGAFITVQDGLTWPAGSTIQYRLRQHDPSTRYDVYWQPQPSGPDTQIYTNTSEYTDGIGDSTWFAFTIPVDTPEGDYHLVSKLAQAENGGGPSTPEIGLTFPGPIKVTEAPFLKIVEGNPQVPGATITIEIGNHAINGEYDVYIFRDGTGIKMPNSPVDVGGDGDGEITFLIPNTFSPGQNYPIRTYLKGTTENPIAETFLSLTAPDLRVTNIEVPATPSFNVPIPITVTIQNDSAVTITHTSFDVDLYIDPPLEPNLGRSLPPGEVKLWLEAPIAMNSTVTLTTEVILYGAFNHEIFGRVDTSGRVIETDELNNLLSVSVTPKTCQIELTGSALNQANSIGFGNADLGTISVSGSEIITITSDGTGGAADDSTEGYFFAYHQLNDDFDIRVRAVNQTGSGLSSFASFGLEVRASLDSDADKLQWVTSNGNSLGWQLRDNGLLDGSFGIGPGGQPVWLRIVKNGSEFTLYYSTDGTNPPVNWTEAETRIVSGLSGNLYVGLINASIADDVTSTVTLDGYHVCGNAGGSCGPVRESGGLIVLHANNYITNIPDTANNTNNNNRVWQEIIRNDRIGMEVPDVGNTRTNGSYAVDSAQLQYEVDVTNPGQYYVWILGAKPNNNGNSVHFGLSSPNQPASNDYYTLGGAANTMTWFNTTNAGDNFIDLSLGANTLSLWMREDGFEVFQILLTQEAPADFSPFDQFGNPILTISQSQCSTLGLPPSPPGLEQCEAMIINGNFEDSELMSEWTYSSIRQSVARTSIPHWIADGENFSMLLPDTTIGGLPRSPSLSQDFTMPSWIITPTLSAGASLNLSMRVGVNPEGTTEPVEPDELLVSLRDISGGNVTNPITVALDSDPIHLVPPVADNSGWQLKQFDLVQGFNQPVDVLNQRGQDLTLHFEAPNSGTDSTRFYIDNVDFEVCSREPAPSNFSTKVAGEIRVLINGIPTPKPGIFVWIYAIDGAMQKTYTIQDSTFSFYDLPADPAGTTYILYAEYEESGTFFSALSILSLKPGDVKDDIALLLF